MISSSSEGPTAAKALSHQICPAETPGAEPSPDDDWSEIRLPEAGRIVSPRQFPAIAKMVPL